MTLDEIFVREFRQMTSDRRAKTKLDLNCIPLPDSSVFKGGIVNANKVQIRNVSDKYFSKLNNMECILLSRPSLKKRVFLPDGSFRKDTSGKLMYTDVPVPQGCVAVLSDINIEVKLSHVSVDKLMYVDFTDDVSRKLRRYIYIIPKSFCYKINQCALVLASNKLRSYYEGCAMFLQNGHKVYLHILPFNPANTLRPYRMLAVKSTCDFKSECDDILNYWENHGVIFTRANTGLAMAVGGSSSCGFDVFPPTLTEYTGCTHSESLSDDTQNIYGTVL